MPPQLGQRSISSEWTAIWAISSAQPGHFIGRQSTAARPGALGYHRRMRPHLLAALAALAAVTAAVPAPARADIGLGLFIGEPLGLDVKIDLERRQALDLLLGVASIRDGGRDYSYGHLTYLLTPLVGRGRSVLVPLRIGIGVALSGVAEGELNVAARAPLELALMFRRTPLELYGEIALKLTFVNSNDNADAVVLDTDGGVGLRFYF